MRLAVIFAGIVSAISGCTSGYEQFYSDESAGGAGFVGSAATESLQVFSSSGDWDQDIMRMYENGYARIGSASFNGSLEGKEGLQEQAIKVGADAVIVSSKFTDSVTRSIPITTTQAVTTYHSGNANVYGSGGSSYGTYSGSSTAYVPSTTYVPVTQRRYDQAAVFFRKLLPSCIGFLEGEISAELRQQIGTNSGVMVAAVRTGAPAYRADIVPGDVLLEIGGRKFYSGMDLGIRSGENVEALVWRRGKLVRKNFVSGSCR